MNMKQLYKFLIDLVFPNRCPCCNKIIKWNDLICEDCINKLPQISKPICNKCGKVNCICDKHLNYDYCVCATYYDGIVKNGIINLKLKNGINFAEYFSNIIIKRIKKIKIVNNIDIVTAVPMTKEKYNERGYNQAFEFANLIAKEINKPVTDKILKKNKSLSQHELSYEERVKYVKDAFSIKNKYNIKNKNILLCDDVITSASTLNECSRILKENGANKVYCAVISTTILKNIK